MKNQIIGQFPLTAEIPINQVSSNNGEKGIDSAALAGISTKYADSLIIETGYTGHRPEYISHLMKFISRHPELHGKFIFLLNSEVESALGQLAYSSFYKVEFSTFQGKYHNSIHKGLEEWKQIEPVLASYARIRSIIFLDLDPYLVLIMKKRFRRYRKYISGILFQPYIHFAHGNFLDFRRLPALLKTRLIQTASILVNPRLYRVFILNDKSGAALMNGKSKNVFRFLPDPVDDRPVTGSDPRAILSKFHINDTRKNLLVFGRIDERKNLKTIFAAIGLLPEGIRQKIRLIIAGQIDGKLSKDYSASIADIADQVEIVSHNDFITDDEREVLFQSADIVLMPYINYYSSSGVLGHSIRHGKPVIVSEQGIIANAVNDHAFGLTVNPLSPEAIKDAILSLLSGQTALSGNNEGWLQEYSPDNFSKLILTAK